MICLYPSSKILIRVKAAHRGWLLVRSGFAFVLLMIYLRKRKLAYFSLLAVAAPSTLEWSPKVAIVMIVCNILAIAIGKFTIKYPNEGPAMPSPNLFGGFGLPAVIGTTCFGHVLGAGAILGLANLGVL